MRLLKYFVVAIVLATVCMVVKANSVHDISGNYYCKGYDPYTNANYVGRVAIKKVGKTYTVTWDLGKGDIYTGTGIYENDVNAFSVLFYKDANVKNAGLATYQVKANGLKGEWIMMEAENKVGFEECVRQS